MNEDTNMSRPTWKWEWNLNTLVVLLGFAGGFVAWGYTLSSMEINSTTNQKNIETMARRITANETTLRQVDNHELRLTLMEKAAADTNGSIKSLERTLNDLASDMKVTREILQRLEAAQKARFQP